MPLIENEKDFDPMARELVVRYIAKMARLLAGQKLVDFDLANLSEAGKDLLFDICFFGIAEFEEQSCIDAASPCLNPRVTFETKAPTMPPTLMLGSVFLHGLVDRDTINEGIARARQDTAPKNVFPVEMALI